MPPRCSAGPVFQGGLKALAIGIIFTGSYSALVFRRVSLVPWGAHLSRGRCRRWRVLSRALWRHGRGTSLIFGLTWAAFSRCLVPNVPPIATAHSGLIDGLFRCRSSLEWWRFGLDKPAFFHRSVEATNTSNDGQGKS